MSYNAIVARIKVKPHPNADRLRLGEVHGYQVVVGIDTEDGELGIFFPTDGQLSEEMCKANNLIGYTDENGERKGGFFAANRRVRSQKFRGEKSDGYWTPLTSLAWAGDTSGLVEGDLLTELNGKPLCNKYFTPATLKQMSAGLKRAKKAIAQFPKHIDTEQFRNVSDRIQRGAIIYFTEKLHGTSGRYGYVLEEYTPPTKWYQWRRRKALAKVSTKKWTHVNGTRNVVLDTPDKVGFHGSEKFRFDATAPLEGRLHPGEVIYFELVGYTTDGNLIMGAQDTTALKDKAITKAFGEKVEYTYGCLPGETKMFVYRIAQVFEDGSLIELPWPQVKKRCRELFIEHVPEMITSKAWPHDENDGELKRVVEMLTEGVSTLDEKHIREGVVLRIENPDGTIDFVKNKSFVFGLLEGYIKERDDYVDTEEIA